MKRTHWPVVAALLLATAFLVVACAPIMRKFGYTEEEIAEIHGVAVEELEKVETAAWRAVLDVTCAVVGAGGTIAAAFLAKWLRTEKKINAAVIQGVEAANSDGVKAEIQAKAVAAGVEDGLHKRVEALTGGGAAAKEPSPA